MFAAAMHIKGQKGCKQLVYGTTFTTPELFHKLPDVPVPTVGRFKNTSFAWLILSTSAPPVLTTKSALIVRKIAVLVASVVIARILTPPTLSLLEKEAI